MGGKYSQTRPYNNLMKQNFMTDDGVVSWEVLRDFYEKDKTLPLCMAAKLPNKHLDLPAFAQLKVSFASQVLSHSVAAGIAFYVK